MRGLAMHRLFSPRAAHWRASYANSSTTTPLKSLRLTVNAAVFCTLELHRLCNPGSESSISGIWIYRAVRSKRTRDAYLEREVGELAWERLALTQEQVDRYDLPVIEKHDRRYNDDHPHEAVETEALSQTIIVEIVRNRLEQLLPEPLNRVQVRATRSEP